MGEDQIKEAQKLKAALFAFLNVMTGRHYGDLDRTEQAAVDLAQALYTRMDQLMMGPEADSVGETPQRKKISERFIETGLNMEISGVDLGQDMENRLEAALVQLDLSSDLSRRARTMRDKGITNVVMHKLGKEK